MSVAAHIAGASAELVLAGFALRMLIQYMGNGVSRLLSCELVPLEAAALECGLPGREAIVFPYPEWVRDLGRQAMVQLGYPELKHGDCVPAGCVRAVDDHTIEVIAWRK